MNFPAAPFHAPDAVAVEDDDELDDATAYDILAQRSAALREALEAAEGAASMLAWAVMGCYVHDCGNLEQTKQNWRPQLSPPVATDLDHILAQLQRLSETVRGARECPGADIGGEEHLTLAEAAPEQLELSTSPTSTASAAEHSPQRSVLRSADMSLALSLHMSSGRFDASELAARAAQVPQPGTLQRGAASRDLDTGGQAAVARTGASVAPRGLRCNSSAPSPIRSKEQLGGTVAECKSAN